MAHRLFVYGTLAPGQSNAHVLDGVSGTWETATVRGKLFPNGWGAAAGFPAIVLDNDEPEVHGLLLSSEELGEHWARLDEFEGEGYERVLTPVRLGSDGQVDAYIYVLRE